MVEKNKFFIKKYLTAFFLASAIFLNLAHLLFNFWGQPARIMILAFILCVPALTLLMSFMWRKVRREVCDLPKKRFFILALGALMLGTGLALGTPYIFKTSILITPQVSGNEFIELLELKSNGHILPISDYAEGYGWESKNGTVKAAFNSRPMLIKLFTPASAPVTLLFGSSLDGGDAVITYGRKEEKISLKSEKPGESLLSFSTHYRELPGWLFKPFLFMMDLIAFGFYALTILFIVESGLTVDSGEKKEERFISHHAGLTILFSFSILLHLVSVLSIPIILNADSPSFLAGATHLVKFGNLEGVSMFRGPGSSLLFAPVQAIFGRNPWGMKTLLHFLAIACVGLNYRLAWQLSGRRSGAFFTGLLTALLPDLYFFSNYVMSDLPNIFLISLFSTLLITAMRTYKNKWIFSSFLTASFAILLRSENMVLLGIGVIALALPLLWQMIQKIENKKIGKIINTTDGRRLGVVMLAALIALAPVFGWSAHNYRKYGFFGMSNYAGEVFYTGWIYYAEASGYPFTDQDSQAVKDIQAAVAQHPIERLNESGVPTGWNLYPSLIEAGYSSTQAFGLMSAAAKDSIKANWRMAWEVLWVKLKDGLTPRPTQMFTYPLPGEKFEQREIEPEFYDTETLRIIPLIKLQRMIYKADQFWYDNFYQVTIWVGLLAAYFCLFRKPTLEWGSLVLIMLSRIFIPDIMGKSDWRYTISGLVLMLALSINCLSALYYGVWALTNAQRES